MAIVGMAATASSSSLAAVAVSDSRIPTRVRASSSSSSCCSLSSSFCSPSCRSLSASTPCSSRFISLHSGPPLRARRNGIFAIDPDFYKIPHVEGIPQGSRLKLFNLPPTDDREKLKRDLLEWFTTIEDATEPITVMSFEYIDDPEWNAQGVGAFVEFGTKWQAVTVYARLDASKFQGRYVRMDFVERKPFPPEWLAKNAKWFSGQNRSNAKIFVGNLAWSVDDQKLQNLFTPHGTVYDAKVLTDRETGRSRGFGFVTMSTEEEMNKAIEALNGFQFEGRALRVNQAANKP